MKSKTIILLFICLINVFAAQVVYAVPAAPGPTCEITAEVLRAEKTRMNIKGGGNPPREDFDFYRIELKIFEISTYEQEEPLSCDSSFMESAEKSGQILSLDEYNKNPISQGQKIKAKINFSGDEWFNGYFLSDIKILEDKK